MINIYAGQRVLYKHNNIWKVGILKEGEATLTSKGLYVHVNPIENSSYIQDVNINDLYLDGVPIPDGIASYTDFFMTKEDYIKFIQSDEFEKQYEHAYVSDGEYIYYTVNKFSEQWIQKQPFDYIVRC